MSTLIQRLKTTIQQRTAEKKQSAQDRFKQLVAAAVADKPTGDVDEVLAILEAVNVDAEQFEKAIANKKERIANSAIFEQLPQLQQQHADISAKQQTVIDDRNKALAKFSETISAYATQLQTIESMIIQAEAAKGRLQASVDDPVLLEDEKRLNARAVELWNQQQQLQDTKNIDDQKVTYFQRQIEEKQLKLKTADQITTRNLRDEIETLKKNLEPSLRQQKFFADQIAPIEKERSEIATKQAELQKRKLVP